jgi:inner membrane protein
VDPLTHTLVGASLGNAFFRRAYGKAAVPILALASNLPDIDGVVMLTGDPASVLLRRTFGHSLLTVPLWSLFLALVLRRFFPRLGFRSLFGMTLLGAGTHLFFDLINSFGVVLLWPVSAWRPELAIVFIIDLVLTSLLAAPLLLCAARRLRPHVVTLSRVALGCVAAYLLLCAALRFRAERALAAAAQRPGAPAEFSYVFPEPLGPHRWRGVVRRDGTYSLYLLDSLSGRAEPRGEVATSLDDPGVRLAMATPLGRRLGDFLKAPVWSVAPHEGARPSPGGAAAAPGGAAVVSAEDLRFRSLILERPALFVFRFRVGAGGRVEPIRRSISIR